jgi:diacylglycerol kinase family enzyme
MGGDGSLGCFIDDLTEAKFSEQIDNLTFVPLPYGTGNDLSRSLGWGVNQGPWGQSLETLVSAIMGAK